ncbi:hypothetical protein GOB87_05585 [Acetobacter estunensis]|uniref:Formate hydrogenlyase subunit 4 n=2 Tax=Acetobacter estunensis TaxID=104097 RepID=A0A967ECM6_9PROT|nr:hypothetical protein [Acetobacter estunensis]NHO53436.1 hypothetical protein [Acetobacter estunensis]
MTLFWSVLLTLLQLLLVVCLAPLCAGLRASFGARLSGQPAPPILRHVFMLGRFWSQPVSLPQGDLPPLSREMVARIAAPVALGAALTASLLLPAFTVNLVTAPWSDAVLVGLLLAFARLATRLSALDRPAADTLWAFGRVVGEVMLLPALLLLVALLFSSGATTALASVLAEAAGGNPFGKDAPLVLAGGVILMFAVRDREERGLEGLGADAALLMLAEDVMTLAWITLATDLMWPAGLLAFHEGALSFGGLALALLCWVGRVSAFSLLLAAGRAIVITPVTAMRLRAAAALLLALVGFQLMTATRLGVASAVQPEARVPMNGRGSPP